MSDLPLLGDQQKIRLATLHADVFVETLLALPNDFAREAVLDRVFDKVCKYGGEAFPDGCAGACTCSRDE